MRLGYDLDKIKFATDSPTFERAAGLYESGKVVKFKEGINAYSAIVLGTRPYHVSVEARQFDLGHCDCYLGQRDTLCKHLVAVAIQAICRGRALTPAEKTSVANPACSGHIGVLSTAELARAKKAITTALKYIKSYTGPSRTWFAYQDSLAEGCRRLSAVIAKLPVSAQTATLLVSLLLRLDRKLGQAVDDSDGTVGGFMEELVLVLKEYAKLDPACLETFHVLQDRQTVFGWEAPLMEMLDNQMMPGAGE